MVLTICGPLLCCALSRLPKATGLMALLSFFFAMVAGGRMHVAYKNIDLLGLLVNFHLDLQKNLHSTILVCSLYPVLQQRALQQSYAATVRTVQSITMEQMMLHDEDQTWNSIMYGVWRKRKRDARKRARRWYVRGKRGDSFNLTRVATSRKRIPRKVHAFAAEKTLRDGTSVGNGVMRFDTDSYLFAVDTGGSYCMTNSANDFIPGTVEDCHVSVDGVGKTVATKKGTVKWTFQDDAGKTFNFDIQGVFYLPTLSVRLFSPQHWSNMAKMRGGLWRGVHRLDSESCVLAWNGGKNKKTVPIHPTSNIFMMQSTPSFRRYRHFLEETNHSDDRDLGGYRCYPAATSEVAQATYVTDDEEDSDVDEDAAEDHSINSTDISASGLRTKSPDSEGAQDETHASSGTTSGTTTMEPNPILEPLLRDGPMGFSFHDSERLNSDATYPERPLEGASAELLRTHYRLGHMGFKRLRHMARLRILPRRLADCKVPTCAACTYGRMTKRAKRTKAPPNKIKPVKIEGPGDCVSVDQMESYTPGFVAQLRGFLTGTRYVAATVFTDHHSRLSKVYMQTNLAAAENLKSKQAWEDFCSKHGVETRHYHADNGHFADRGFLDDVEDKGQTITFCGVNAHFQNGISEKRIRDLQDAARTVLLDAKSRWPKAISTALWPYALRYVNECFNIAPPLKATQGSKSPLEIFADVEVTPNLKDYHPFGCPVYCLNDKLQAGKSINKWLPRARLGIYLGFSPNHARNVGLVLNHRTGLVSPQFHAKYDDLWETVNYHRNSMQDMSAWKGKAGFEKDGEPTRVRKQRNESEVVGAALRPAPLASRLPAERASIEENGSETTASEGATGANQTTSEGAEDETAGGDDLSDPDFGNDEDPKGNADGELSSEQDGETGPADNGNAARRSGRRKRATPKYQAYLEEQRGHANAYIAFEALDERDPYRTKAGRDPIYAFAGRSSDPDTMYHHEAMRAHDAKEFQEAMAQELDTHEKREHWELMLREDVPADHYVHPAVWAMKRKRRVATGEIYKRKARLNFGGHKQKKYVNFWQTYSPVVGWPTIRFFLTLALIHGWHTRQYDFVLAYPQADVETELYMDVPRGYKVPKGGRSKDYCMKVKKNLYGQRQAGRVWNRHLHNGLIGAGFVSSDVDQCLYFRDSTILLIYVDDCLMIDPDLEKVQRAFEDIKAQGFDMTDEGNLKDYLGVDVDKREDGTIHLTQPKLITRILESIGFKTAEGQNRTKPRNNPALIGRTLLRSLDEPEHDKKWEYRSIIGMLNFLEKSTRPDLAFASHQAACFSADPRLPHTNAVMHLCRYLCGTSDKGLIFKPETDKDFEVYADASLGGDWHSPDASDDRDTARSRMGYVIKYAGCPILWTSRLITEVCLSTTEAEYCALSEALRQVIPLMDLQRECVAKGILKRASNPDVFCTAFEDNSGALEMARTHKARPRTKHMNLRYHFFRDRIATDGEEDNGDKIHVKPVATENQLADIFTKAVAQELFLKFRYLILGW